MPIPFPYYATIKDECCLCYFGNSTEYIVQLKYLRPLIEKELFGINIHLCIKSEFSCLLRNENRVLFMNDMAENKNKFAFVKEILTNTICHPIELLLKESDIKIERFKPVQNGIRRAVILTKGILPTNDLSEEQINIASNFVRVKGYEPVINGKISEAGLVLGVENADFYEAAFSGIPTTLIPTGIGTEFYRNIIDGNILDLSI